MLDLIIAGAGPAGSIAALIAARAGARVLVVDRETFPRDKLCGDTLNPGALALLASLDLSGGPLATGHPLAGMLLTGPRRRLEGRYGPGVTGIAIRRHVFDTWLLERAIAAGAHFEPGLSARRPLQDDSGRRPLVRGLVLSRRGSTEPPLRIPANMTIAADGRGSVLARALNLSVTPDRPRRWAFGVYVTGITGTTDLGEMHVRPGRYLGIAPIGGGLFNVCAVTGARPQGKTPLEVVRRTIDADPGLRARFAGVDWQSPVRVLGPLAVETRQPGVSGLLLAGDAAGFVDPMTGDGLHLAMRGAILATRIALQTLETGDFDGAVESLADARRVEIGRKHRFNRLVRGAVESSAAIELASWSARIAPGLLRWAVRYAGDAA